MSNPFEALNMSDDQQDQFVTSKTDKVRKTHKERRDFKKQGPETTTPTTVITQGADTQVPTRVKDNNKQGRHYRQERPVKGVPQGHTFDRRSGTGREDRPRKQGGGRGNVGNVRDELNSDKYEKPTLQIVATTSQQTPVEQTKPQEPQKMTLSEYYQSIGVDLSLTSNQRKAPVRVQVDADWLKKQKLTLIQTKEDKKRQQVVKQNILQNNNTRVETNIGNSELLGFGTKPVQKPREEQQPRDNKDRTQKGKKPSAKVVLKEDDFPTL